MKTIYYKIVSKKLLLAFFLVVALVGVFIPNDLISIEIKTAHAQQACGGPYEVVAGQTGSITVDMQGPFGVGCKPALVTSYNGINFDNQYMGTQWCSNGMSVQEYATQSYDATSYPTNGSFPQSFYATIEANFDTGGECELYQATVEIIITSAEPTFSLSCTPTIQSITVGGTTSYNMSTTPVNGFNSTVNFSASISPNVANGPSISYTNNNQTPSATTTAVVSTSGSTPANSYTLTFTGTGGGVSQQCVTQLVVNPTPPPPPGFSLSVTPSSTDTLKGSSPTYTVQATCTGGYAGPIGTLSAISNFTGLNYSFSNSTIACGSSVTLTITGTASVPQNQLSTPQSRLPQTITVTGVGQ